MHVVILGNGVTGATAALQLRKLQPDWRITMISGESTHPYSRPALMYLFMGHLRYRDTKPYEDRIWRRERIELLRDWVTRIDLDGQRLELHRGEPLSYDRLLIATGSQSNRFGWPGQDLDGVQGLYDLMDLRCLYETLPRVERAVIVGGGLIGIEFAEMLHSRNIHVTLLVRESSYWNNVLPAEESAMVNRLIRQAGFELRLDSELKEIVDDGEGRVAAVLTGADEQLDCQLVGLTAGVRPNIEMVQDSGIPCGRGVLVDSSLQTQVEGVFAAGDCAEVQRPEGERNLLQQVWYTGKMQGAVAAAGLAGEPGRYDPGIWYNSAKFLDLEYQTYGQVNLKVPGEKNLFWEHPDHLHALRIVYTEDGVIGLNCMGLRYRHEVCERWIQEQRPVQEVLDQLGEAVFDPEFYLRHEGEIATRLKEQLS